MSIIQQLLEGVKGQNTDWGRNYEGALCRGGKKFRQAEAVGVGLLSERTP